MGVDDEAFESGDAPHDKVITGQTNNKDRCKRPPRKKPKKTTNLAILPDNERNKRQHDCIDDDDGDNKLHGTGKQLPKNPRTHPHGEKKSSTGTPSYRLPGEYEHILMKYKDVIQQAQDEDPSLQNDPRTQEQMLQILKRWDPQTDVICLYVRWARQLPKNFHLDSIATLLCLSNQCDYTPINFLTTVKTLHAIPSKNDYGFTIHYNFVGRKLDSKGQQLNLRLKGISLTLALLQANVTRSNGLLGKTKMREKPGSRRPLTMHVNTGDNESPSNVSFTANPQIEFHTGNALANRMWLSVYHRWMALHVVEHLFRPKDCNMWNDQAALEYSFQMFSGFGRSRYDYLDPLTGVCLYFVAQDQDIEPNRIKLDKVWSDANLFVPFANNFLNSITEREKVLIMVEAFRQLDMNTEKRYTYQPYQTFEKRWLLLRCFIFQHWLTRKTNKEMKKQIEDEIKRRKSGKVNPSTHHAKSSIAALTQPTLPPVTPQGKSILPVATKTTFSNGLHSLESSQGLSILPVISTKGNSCMDVDFARPQNQQPLPTSTLMEVKRKYSQKSEWTMARLLHPTVMDQLCASYLIIHREDGVDVLSRLSPLEIYSADWLCKRKHGRFSGGTNYYPSDHVGPVSLSISTNTKSFLDAASGGSYQVARAGSSYLNQHGSMLPNLEECIAICRAVLVHGKPDDSRSSEQFRINVGCGGQDRRDGIPCKIHDSGFKAAIADDSLFNDETNVPHLIGQCVEVIWKIVSDMLRDSNCSPMAPDPHRDWEYARHLRQYLGIATQVGFEDVTVVVSSLYPTADTVNLHLDHMNDNVAGYTRTGALNICFGLGEPITKVFHLQIIANFRKVIREYMLPFIPALKSTYDSVKNYLQTWQHDMDRIFGGKTTRVPTPFDRSNFFLDDALQFKSVAIFEDIRDDFILTTIGPSRTLSLSLFIEPIYLLQKRLMFDQRLELCFAASLLSNPFWFDHVLRLLMKQDSDPHDSFRFGVHPFFDWVQKTQETFGGQWQGGPHNRWSPCGGGKPVPELFGATRDALNDQREVGRMRLEKVVSILYKHVSWINSLAGRGDNCFQDMPLDLIREQMESTCKEIYEVVPCQFSLFRLCIFTTLIAGCGELTPGRHLRQLMFPIKNTASYEHLLNTSVGKMSKKQARELCQMNGTIITFDGHTRIEPESHDLAMLYLSTYLNQPTYNRDEMECLLCESLPGRNLSCCDWFRKGQRLFDIDHDGRPLVKEYGRDSQWKPIQLYDKLCNCAYLTPYIVFIPRNEEVMRLAGDTGRTIRASTQIIFEGRCTKTSAAKQQYSNNYANSSIVFPTKFEYRVANFYCHVPVGRTAVSKMRVLGNSVSAKALVTEANSLHNLPIGMCLMDYISWLLTTNATYSEEDSSLHPMHAACYHQEIVDTSNMTGYVSYFPGHRDKGFVHQAIFVPLTERVFYTFIAIPLDWKVHQDVESYSHYSQWKERLTGNEITKLTNFETSFQKEAQLHMKVDVETHIFKNQLGSVLSFPANICYHATVMPGISTVDGINAFRDLFIVHPLELTS